MKRILSLVLALTLVLGSVPVAFAAEETAGDKLKEAGFVAGDQNGNLNEDDKLTREQMMVLIAEMNGVKEEAATFGIPADFSDVNENDWFAPYVWYAFYQGWTAGMGDGSFGAGVAVDSKMAATFMLKALDYEVADYNTSVAQAADLGIKIETTSEMTRGEGFEAMWSTVNLPKKDSEVALGVELGKIEEEKKEVAELAAKLDAVEAIGNALVEVTFDDDVDAAAAEAATYVVTERGTTTEVAVKSVMSVDTDRVYVETAAMTAGKAYTIALGEDSKNFTGIAKETSKPKVDSVKGTDTDRVEVAFDSVMDKATAEDIANYSIDKIGTVTDAELKSDNKTVELSVEGFTKAQSAQLTVENVLNVDGVAITKVSKNFYSKFDTAAPKIDKIVKANNNVEVIVYFTDDHGVDEAVAEDISNYSIEGLDILEATAAKKDTADKSIDFFKKVTLKTSAQSANKKYTLKVLSMVDGSTSKNAISKELTETFYGGREDKTEPNVIDMYALSLTQVAVKFDDKNNLDPTTALDVTNYTVAKDELTVLNAEFKDGDEDEMTIFLTVSEMDEDESYKFEVLNVTDEFGNAIEKKETDYVTTKATDLNVDGPTSIKSVTVKSLTELEVEFAHKVTSETAEDPTNYEVDGDVGKALTAEFKSGSDDTVVVTFPEMKANKSYDLSAIGVETFTGYATESAEKSFVATSTSADTDQPEVESVTNDDRGILKVEFSEEIVGSSATVEIRVKDSTVTATAYNLTAITGEDDNIAVFDVSALESAKTGKVYEITKFNNLTDVAGNTVDYKSGDQDFSTDDSTYEDYEVTHDNVFQENIKTIRVTYDNDVLIANKSITIGGKTFTAEIDDDFDNEVVLTYTGSGSPFADDKEITISDVSFKQGSPATASITDLIGRGVKDQTDDIKITWDASDDVDPEMVRVEAKNTMEIVVYYDEDIDASEPGSYKIYDADDKVVSMTITATVDSDNADEVKLKLSKALEAGDYYTVKQTNDRAEDLAGNRAVEAEDGLEFVAVGTPYVENTIDGIALINGVTVEVKDDEALSAGTYRVKSGSAIVAEFSVTATDVTNAESAAVTGITNVTAASNDDAATAKLAKGGKTLTITVSKNWAFVDNTSSDEYTVTAPGSFSETFDGIVDVLEEEAATANDNKFVIAGMDIDPTDADETETLYVYANGVLQTSGYTLTNGDTITFTSTPADPVVVVIEENGIIKSMSLPLEDN